MYLNAKMIEKYMINSMMLSFLIDSLMIMIMRDDDEDGELVEVLQDWELPDEQHEP